MVVSAPPAKRLSHRDKRSESVGALQRLAITRVNKLVLKARTIGGVDPTPQTIMARTATVALQHIDIRVPAALALFQKKPANTGTKMEPDSSV